MTSQPRTIRIVNADSNQMTCRLLSEALEKEPGLCVVGSAVDYETLARLMQSTKPDIALISSTLPGGPLRTRTHAAGGRVPVPSCPWVVLLDESEPNQVVAAFRAGAKGVFSRTQPDIRMLAKCIRRVMEGQVWVDSQQMLFLLDAFSGNGSNMHGAEAPAPKLTRREQSVVRLVMQGMVNREIAHELGLSEHTIKNYLFRIFDKLGVSNRVELALYAVAKFNLGDDAAA
ncbi:MAG TPA: response regulator transcription factor [Candidatus Eisenbacteria bacterium]|nr:response regulator transcription factor [Candidatus Eisenbacteria bacterium]